jgi:prepilin-type N-terminal cleavage/methylation domain-containing protein
MHSQPYKQRHPSRSSAFTLIELLVVIAIIAILAVVVVLTLNPAQLLAQSRDANRISDMATLQSATSLLLADLPGVSLGNASSAYIALPDTSTTCGNLGLPVLFSGYSYNCASSASYRNVNSSGWVPLSFASSSAGSPIGVLPVDPANQTSSNLYYTYTGGSGQYVFTTFMESQKYAKIMSATGGTDSALYEVGTGIATLPNLGRGLVGYWPMEEGVGTTTFDWSGNQNNGTWSGTQSGTSGYYSPGKVGNWAGTFNGSAYANTGNSSSTNVIGGDFTVSIWVMASSTATTKYIVERGSGPLSASDQGYLLYLTANSGGQWVFALWPGGGTGQISVATAANAGIWHLLTGVFKASTKTAYLYLDGTYVAQGTNAAYSTPILSANSFVIGAAGDAHNNQWSGFIDDVRIYNRALSATEVQELYSAEK